MLEAFQTGKDIHSATASRVFDVPYEEVAGAALPGDGQLLPHLRAGAHNLSQQLDIKRSRSKELIDQHFLRYPAPD